jgi:hypothetical protein
MELARGNLIPHEVETLEEEEHVVVEVKIVHSPDESLVHLWL